jgi:hypothetical protein
VGALFNTGLNEDDPTIMDMATTVFDKLNRTYEILGR